MFHRTLFSVLFIVFLSFSVNAQAYVIEGEKAKEVFPQSSLVRMNNDSDVPSYVLFEKESKLSEEKVLSLIKEHFKLDDNYSFKPVFSKVDRLGIKHIKYAQYYKGIELVYSALSLHITNGVVESFSGSFSKMTPESFNSAISKKEALQIALDVVDAEEYYHKEDEIEVILTYLPLNIVGDKKIIVPTFKANIYAIKPLSRTLFFINANSGDVEFTEELIHHSKSEGIAVTAYSDTQKIITDSLPNVFRLVDSSRGKGIETYNCRRTRNYDSAVHFLDTNNFWNNFNAQLDEYATDAHWGTEATYDYLKEVHNYNSIDDSGFTLISYIHYGVNYVNAFWNGDAMTYGDGDSSTNPLTTLDIVGHEIVHGLTDNGADLIYANESGALNESFSDIFGTAVEFYARPSRWDWTVGEDIGRSIRSMETPNAYNDPDTYEGQFWIDQNCIPTRFNDRCGVHTNSGVQNFWFYLLSEGGVGINDNLDSFKVNEIGIKKAEEIAFRNLMVYLSPSSSFDDARFFSIISAIDLFGACSPEVEAVTNAWHAVGVGEKYESGVRAGFSALTDTSYCFYPATVEFQSTSNNVVGLKWDFGNGDTSSLRNPIVNYNDTGSYTVKLIADGGGCGSDTIERVNYITLDTTIACAYFLSDTINQLVSVCEGRLYDSGGSGEDYEDEKSSLFTIDVPSADYIELSFKNVALEPSQGFSCNRDYIEVYDGESTDSKMIGRYCSEHLPPAKLNSTSNKVTIRFYADEFINDDGFLMEWKCMNSSTKPIVSFSTLVDTSCTGEVPFYNETTGGATSYLWKFGDGITSTEVSPTHYYYHNGTYEVSLIATNSVGTDSLVKSAFVVIDKLANPIVEGDSICINDRAGVKVISSENVEWYFDTLSNIIGTNDSLVFNNMQNDTSLFVKEITKTTSITGSFKDNMGAGEFSIDNNYLQFDVLKPIIIERITMNSKQRGGGRALEIRNYKGEIVGSTDVSVSGRRSSTSVGIELLPDTAYKMSISDRETELFMNTSGASYPYDIGGLVTITGSNLPNTHFPYFYEWRVSELSCESNFAEVKITVDTSCVITDVSENKHSAALQLYPNPFSNQIIVEGLSKLNVNSIHLLSPLGQLLREYSIENITVDKVEFDLSALKSGMYYFRIETEQGIENIKVLKAQ